MKNTPMMPERLDKWQRHAHNLYASERASIKNARKLAFSGESEAKQTHDFGARITIFDDRL